MSQDIILEMCVGSVEEAIAAQHGGAKRVELCDNLLEGGTTPSAGAIKICREHLDIKLHVIIRPRGADFDYSEIEFEIMKRDIEIAKELGCDGVALSILNTDGTIDRKRTAELIALARPMSFTFVRGFDVTRDPFEALDDLISIGVDRVLTTGQCGYVIDGLGLITELVKKASDKIIVMPGSASIKNIAKVIKQSGAKEVHTYLSDYVDGEMSYRKKGVFMGGDGPLEPEFEFRVLQIDNVKQFINSM